MPPTPRVVAIEQDVKIYDRFVHLVASIENPDRDDDPSERLRVWVREYDSIRGDVSIHGDVVIVGKRMLMQRIYVIGDPRPVVIAVWPDMEAPAPGWKDPKSWSSKLSSPQALDIIRPFALRLREIYLGI